MLVLSRKLGESVEFPGLGIVIRVTAMRRSRVQLGIEAPPEYLINRGERPLADKAEKMAEGNRIRDELSRLEAEAVALAELAGEQHQREADCIATEMVQRIRSIRRSLHLAICQTDQATMPIGDYVRVRDDVMDELRRAKSTADDHCDRVTQVRQQAVEYRIGPVPTLAGQHRA